MGWGGGLIIFFHWKGGFIRGRGLIWEGGGGGSLIEDLRYLDLSSCQYHIPSSPNRSLPSAQSSRLFLRLLVYSSGTFMITTTSRFCCLHWDNSSEDKNDLNLPRPRKKSNSCFLCSFVVLVSFFYSLEQCSTQISSPQFRVLFFLCSSFNFVISEKLNSRGVD